MLPASSNPSPLNIKATFAGKHFLVTGVTGFVGKIWLAMLLDFLPEVSKLSLLIRSNRKQTAEERWKLIMERSPALRPLREKHGAGYEAFMAKKIEVINGDIVKPLAGFDEETLDRLAASVDAVVHIAGLVDFEPEPIQAININVRGSQNMADLAVRCGNKRMVHVSTCFVAGKVRVGQDSPETITPGISPNGTLFEVEQEIRSLESLIERINSQHPKNSREARTARIKAGNMRAETLGWTNIYTYSKGLSEQSLALRKDLHVSTVRPSIVECSLYYPFPGWNEGINTSGPIVWLCGGFARRIPLNGDNTFDIIPVDTVCRGLTLALAAMLNDDYEEIYQLASGDLNPINFERIVDLTGLAYRRHYQKWDATPVQRALLRYLDVVPSGADPNKLKMIPAANSFARGMRSLVGKFNVEKHLPARLRKVAGDKIGHTMMRNYVRLTSTDRLLRRLQGLLQLFRPFIFENNYLFRTRHSNALNERLSEEEMELFSFNIEGIDWRHYWLNIEVPGLLKWSIPLIRGEKIPSDPPRAEQLALLNHADRRISKTAEHTTIKEAEAATQTPSASS